MRCVTTHNNRIECPCRMYEQSRIACRHIMAITKHITLDFVGVRYLKLFKYVSLRNDGSNNLFTDVMDRYKHLYNDNRNGIRISNQNLVFPDNDKDNYPKQILGNINYLDMCDIMNWKSNNVVKNINNHVLPDVYNDIRTFLENDYNVPNGLYQKVQLSSQNSTAEDSTDNDNISNIIESGKGTFYSRSKPIFDEIVKQVENNPNLSDEAIVKFQEILNYTKVQNNPTITKKNGSQSIMENNIDSDSIVSYHAKLDNRHQAKRHKYHWEK